MPFQKGQSGNPSGRPPKGRALTDILEAAGNSTVKREGKPGIARKRLIADMLWEAATTYNVTFPDDVKRQLEDTGDWFNIVQFLYRQIDGLPKQELDVTSDGEAIKVYVGVDPEQV